MDNDAARMIVQHHLAQKEYIAFTEKLIKKYQQKIPEWQEELHTVKKHHSSNEKSYTNALLQTKMTEEDLEAIRTDVCMRLYK
tara:strand:+ start:3658 stop:3906 length:249 start_codon:yes stop_codon:yes gene_type:complete